MSSNGNEKATGLNPGKAGPKGALEEAPAGGRHSSPLELPNHSHNERRDFVQLPKKKRKPEK
jgi:hypothetical protein